MSLNRYEQMVFDYWQGQPEERHHWQAKVIAATQVATEPGALARSLERELWDYFVERSQQVPLFRNLGAGGIGRVSLLNLADHMLRLWGPPPTPKKSPAL